MPEVIFARAQMGMSLAFHIIFAAIGVAMPVLMVLADLRHRRTGDPEYLELSRRWAKGTAVLFAVGAVSGTVLSFELGLLFPEFMRRVGAVIGLPFALEGVAFFTEAVFLGIYLYGRDRIPGGLHLASGVLVAVSGAASAVFVTIANAWMNAPRGFRLEGGELVDPDPLAAMANPYALHEVPHTLLACYLATAGLVAGIHAFALLGRPGNTFHRKALKLALIVAIPAALAQPLVGHMAGQAIARMQPAKLAALEGHERTQARAPIRIGPIEIPAALSIMAFNDPDAVVRGLEEWPPEDRPHPSVRLWFQVMVGAGMLLALHAAWALLRAYRRRPLDAGRGFLRATALAAPLGMLAMEAGWLVTEMGRQPWTVYGVLRTSDAVTPVPGLIVPLVTFTLLYILLAVIVVVVLVRQVRPTVVTP